jgi:hypothetical protein
MFPIQLIPGAISELLAVVRDTHKITKADRYGLMAAILDEKTVFVSIASCVRFTGDESISWTNSLPFCKI